MVIGFDTSNYTTSIAAFDGSEGENVSRLLPVKPGELGLRQSDALFHHVKRLPELSGGLLCHIYAASIRAIGVSTRPRAVEGSYMPCFLAGVGHATVLSQLLKVPLIEVSHQQGHVAACLWSAGHMELMDRPFLAWHLSGGTTELLYVTPEGKNVHCEKIGGTSDISAGQLIDRTAQLLELPFPGGKHLDALSQEAGKKEFFKVKTKEFTFSFSGVQNKVQQYAGSNTKEDTAWYALASVAWGVAAVTKAALAAYPDCRVVFSGGVASNILLRRQLAKFDPIFCPPQYSTDNALGVAVLAHRLTED